MNDGRVRADPDGRWPALFILGPTATGKTDLALAVAERLPAALISVDSALVYRGLDIGSAKPDRATLARHPHALIDIRDPAQPYSAADFRQDALEAMMRARSQGRLPVLVGGTMLYFNVLERGIAKMPAADPALRARLVARAERDGYGTLHAELGGCDPEAAGRIHRNDPQRLLRALEVFELSGRPMSWWWRQAATDAAGMRRAFAPRQVALVPGDRAVLHARIGARFDAMLEAGLIEEVRRLHGRGDLDPTLPALRAVGYRQVWSYLEGECDLAEMRQRALVATRGLLRRQLTWLRRYPGFEGLIDARTTVNDGDGALEWPSAVALERILGSLNSIGPATIVVRS